MNVWEFVCTYIGCLDRRKEYFDEFRGYVIWCHTLMMLWDKILWDTNVQSNNSNYTISDMPQNHSSKSTFYICGAWNWLHINHIIVI